MKKNYLTTTIKIAISLIILVILIYKLDYKILLDNLIIFPILGIGLFMTNYFMTIILNSLALFLILDYKKKRISFKEFLKMNWFSFSLGQFSPARSGEVSIVYFLKKKYNIPIGESSASFIIYKMFTMITLLLFAIFTAYIYFNSLYNWHLILIIFLIIIFGFLFTITNSKIRFLIKKYIKGKENMTMNVTNIIPEYFESTASEENINSTKARDRAA